METDKLIGARVRVTGTQPSIYKEGAFARLVDFDGRDWWAQFRNQGNAVGSWCDEIDGIWCVGREGIGFVLLEI